MRIHVAAKKMVWYIYWFYNLLLLLMIDIKAINIQIYFMN